MHGDTVPSLQVWGEGGEGGHRLTVTVQGIGPLMKPNYAGVLKSS